MDVDIVLAGSVAQTNLDAAMSSAGFTRRGDQYVSRATPFFVEFPPGPLAVGADHNIRPVRVRRGGSRMFALSATDACRDRLAAYYHWNDRQALAVAVEIAVRNRVRVSLIRAWSEGEGKGDRFEEFLAERMRARSRRAGASRRIARRSATS